MQAPTRQLRLRPVGRDVRYTGHLRQETPSASQPLSCQPDLPATFPRTCCPPARQLCDGSNHACQSTAPGTSRNERTLSFFLLHKEGLLSTEKFSLQQCLATAFQTPSLRSHGPQGPWHNMVSSYHASLTPAIALALDSHCPPMGWASPTALPTNW